jgi:hypothetical protein
MPSRSTYRAAPPFPDDVLAVPLAVVDFGLVSNGCRHEIDKLWSACTSVGVCLDIVLRHVDRLTLHPAHGSSSSEILRTFGHDNIELTCQRAL